MPSTTLLGISGASFSGTVGDNDGVNKLKNLDVALLQTAGELRLYFEWQARAADQNENLKDATGAAISLPTDLCGQQVNVDSRLSVYCLRFL